MDEEIMRMTDEINHTYDQVQAALKDLKTKKERLMIDVDNLKSEGNKLNLELVSVNMEIDARKEKIDSILNEGGDKGETGNFNLDMMSANCKQVLSNFINDASVEGAKSTLFYKIEYGRLSIMRQVDDENMTFSRLKLETKIQFDKNENEFYFTDEVGNIFLDDLNVKRVLFSLASTTVKGFTPIIKVVDRVNKIAKSEMPIKQKSVQLSEIKVTKKMQQSLTHLVEFLKKNYFNIFHLIIFTIFMACYISSCMMFRSVKDFSAMISYYDRTNLTKLNSNVNFYK